MQPAVDRRARNVAAEILQRDAAVSGLELNLAANVREADAAVACLERKVGLARDENFITDIPTRFAVLFGSFGANLSAGRRDANL
jgi:hypothetical protein